MPRVDFGSIPDANDYTPAPPGTYTAQVIDGIEGESRGGDDMWTLTFKIAAGQYRGKTFKDRLTWSKAALPRVKLFLRAIGFDVEGVANVDLQEVLGKVVDVDLRIDEFEGVDGLVKLNNVTFAGYREASSDVEAFDTSNAGSASKYEASDDDIPFVAWLPVVIPAAWMTTSWLA